MEPHMTATRYPLFVRRDLDGFFGLFIDNLIQLLLILQLCADQCGMTGENRGLLFERILPGAGISIILGNLFYAWQARRLAIQTGRDDVTALPYGINTPSLLIYVYFVMGPVYRDAIQAQRSPAQAAQLAWEMGLLACLGSGLIEFFGSFVAESIRKRTPRAALLSTLAGIAIGFIAMQFALQIFHKPLLGMLPLAIVLITYFSQAPFPFHLPGGFIAVLLGTATAWGLTLVVQAWPQAPTWIADSAMSPVAVTDSLAQRGFYVPRFFGETIWHALQDPERKWLGHLSVIIPMGLFNLIGSLQNIESAEAAGDRYRTGTSLAVNGIGTIAAALFGSCFPTTIYIGHPGWKQLGARAGYSTLNGVVVTALCLTGTVGVMNALVPREAGASIVLWIGIVITAQAFAACSKEHAPAVAVGLFPAIVAWGLNLVQATFFISGGKTMQDVLTSLNGIELQGYLLEPMIIIDRGYIFTCMILAAISAFLIDRKFFTAGIWALIGALFAGLGLTHAFQLIGNVFDFLYAFSEPKPGFLSYRAWPVMIGYLLSAAMFFAFGVHFRRLGGKVERVEH
jgi:AGZA family xanthine/uracil permease-like MFS transporter